MRRAMLMVLALAGACNDDSDSPRPGDASTPVDAATVVDAAAGDAGVPADASTPRSLLPRFGTLEHPPTALPADLKPPR